MVLHTDDDVTVDHVPTQRVHRRRRADGRRRRPRRPHRQHADGAARPHRPRRRLPPARQARALQPRLLVEGPAGAAHDRERRGRRPPAARRHDRRADQRQHRRRASPSSPPAGATSASSSAPTRWRRDKIAQLRAYGAEVDRVPDLGRPRAPRLATTRCRDRLARELPGRVEARPVPQPRQPPGPVRDHRPGDLGADQRAASPTSCAASAPAAPSPASAATSRSSNPAIRTIGADPEGSVYSGGTGRPYLVEGIGEDFWPTTYDPSVVDEVIPISDAESFATARRVTREEGLLIGGSGGTAVAAALQGRRRAAARRRGRRAHPRLRPRLPVEALRRRLDGRPRLPPRRRAHRRRPPPRARRPTCPRSCTPTPTRRCARPSRSCASSG